MSERVPSELCELAQGRHRSGLWIDPIYQRLGFVDALNTIRIRESLMPRLLRAAVALSGGSRRDEKHGLLLWDGWRSLSLQGTLYEQYTAALKASSGLNGAPLAELVGRFVTDPARRTAPPAHSTGGAIDLTLCDPDTGTARDMGGTFDELTSRSLPEYYDGDLMGAGRLYARRRAAMRNALIDAGFVAFPTEWWHFEYGADLWAERHETQPVFGLINS